MPLIDLQTDLKSLKYGQDRPGGGFSGQPFIVTNPNGATNLSVGPNSILRLVGINNIPAIPNISSQLNRSRIGQFVNQVLYDDTFIRGGAAGSIQTSLNDLFRIGAFMTSLPRGPLFIAKQVGLQLSNPRLEVPKNIFNIASGAPGNVLSVGTNGLLQPTRLYNLGINTLAQVPANAFGIHFNRHGLLPVQSDASKYEAVVTANNDINGSSKANRLVGLTTKFKLGDRTLNQTTNRRVLNTISQAITTFTGIPINIKPQDLIIDDYAAGPNSVYGIGRTTINRYSNTEDGYNIGLLTRFSSQYAGKTRDQSGIPQAVNLSERRGVGSNAISNYSTDISSLNGYLFNERDANGNITNLSDANDISLVSISDAFDNNSINLAANPILKTYQTLKGQIDKTTNISQEIPFVSGGYSTSTYKATISTKSNIIQKSNGFKYYGNAKLTDSGSRKEYDNTNLFSREDAGIMSVLFRAVNPFGQPEYDPKINMNTNEQRWIFSAYMNNYKDDFNATWNEVNYVGRSESFYIYNKFKRSVSFSLKIPCFNKTQLFEKHRALGQLASVTAGSYRDGLLLSGVLLKVNVGNYLKGEYAVLNSLNYSIPDEASWDISDDALLSMYLDVSINLTIVHKALPQYQQANGTSGFFGYLPDPVNSTDRTKGFITSDDIVNKFQKDQ
jgi:hypothetical protein